jgi:hypothetical protein
MPAMGKIAGGRVRRRKPKAIMCRKAGNKVCTKL